MSQQQRTLKHEGGKRVMEDFNPFHFAGGIGRFRYFGYSVVWGLIIFVADVFIATADPAGEVGLFTAGALLLSVTLLLATLSYWVRRLHDFDQSGWWYLLMVKIMQAPHQIGRAHV